MSKKILTDVEIRVGAYDISGDSNQVSVEETFTEVEKTVFGDAAHNYLPGLPKIGFSMQGYAEADDTDYKIDDIIQTYLGASAATPISWCPETAADGGLVYFTKGLELDAQRGGTIGEMYGFQASGVGKGEFLIRGDILEDASAAITSTGTGTAQQTGAVAASQKVYGILQVMEASGTDPTLDVVVQSDDASGFAAPTSRITFAQATDVTSEWKSTDGAITDDWWRVSYTIGGTDTPTFKFFVGIGIR